MDTRRQQERDLRVSLPGMASRREFLLATASALGAFAMAPDQAAAPPAGIVLIVADRETPASEEFASLAARAARFTRCYAADPASVRGREAILRGRFPHLGGLTGNPGGIALHEHLATAGWRTVSGSGTPALASALKAGGRYCAVLEPPADTGMACLRSAAGLLERAGVLDDTLLVFTAARGGDTEAWFDRDTRVPLLFQWPRRIAAGEPDLLASAVDVMPAILGLCGVPAPDGLQGLDLSPWLLRGNGIRPESIYAEGRLGTRQSWRMMVRGLDKLVFTPRLEIVHLYNLGQDPGETTDLAGDPAEERKLDELRAIAANWMRRLADEMDPSGLKRR
jgi:arylsulfatase A-like enzyme